MGPSVMKAITARTVLLSLVTMAVAAAATIAIVRLANPTEELPRPEHSKRGGAVSMPDSPKVKDSVSPFKLQNEDH